MLTDTGLIFSTYTNILTSYPKIYHTFLVTQNFIISTCLSKVLTNNFLEYGNSYNVEIFRVE